MPKKKSIRIQDKKPTYETFLRSVKLYSLALDEMSAHLDREKYWDRPKKQEDVIREIGSTYKSANVEGDHFDVQAKFELTIAAKDDKSPIVKIKCTYSAHFHSVTDCNDVAAERFAKSEAKIILWPYFRHFVSDMSGRMHIPPIIIPLTLD